MKKILLLLFLFPLFCSSQQNKMFGNGGWNLNGYFNYWLNGSDSTFLIRPMGIKLPIGNTAQRPVALTSTLRWNSDSVRLEIYNGSAWKGISFNGEALTSISIGTSIGSATANKVFYAGTGGALQQSTKFSFDSTNNRLGIGRATPSQKLDIGDTSFTTSVVQNIGSEKAFNNSTSDATAQAINFNTNTRLLGTSNYNISSSSLASFDIATLNSTIFHSGTGLCGTAVGQRIGIRTTSTGNINNAIGMYLNMRNTDTMTNYYGIYIAGNDATTSGWVNNYYALHCGITAGTSGVNSAKTYGLFAPNNLMNHYINGSLLIGDSAATPFGLNVQRSVSINKDSATRVTSLGTNVIALIDTTNGKVQTITGANLATAIGATSYTFSTGLTNTSGTVTNNLSTGVNSTNQTATGSTQSGGSFTLQSTTNATKGYINFGAANNSSYNEDADSWGFGSPSFSNSFLTLGTGTTTKASLVIPTGTLNTTPVDGAIEKDANNLYISSGGTPVRYTLAKTLTNTATLDFGSTAAGTSTDLTITVTGAATGDVVSLGAPASAYPGNCVYTAFVSAADTVTVRFANIQAVGSIDPSSAVFRVSVIKY